MLRLLVLVLLLGNVSYWAWSHGWLTAQGLGPVAQHEPQRLAGQLAPQAVRVLADVDTDRDSALVAPAAAASAAEAASSPDGTPAEPSTAPGAPAPPPDSPASAPSAAPTACWQWTNLEAAQVDTLRPLLQAGLPADGWVLDEVQRPGRWLVYMGKYANTAELAKKRDQLTVLKIPFETLRDPALAPGLSLGVFSSEQGANKGLQEMAQRGVRTARVLQLRPPSQRTTLRLPALTPAQLPVLERLNTALPGQAASACTQTPEPPR